MDFPYSPASQGDLAQGDVLRLTEDLQRVLDTYHPYYIRNPENRYFIVLTQSCDLVRRTGGTLGTRYLALAPVRLAQQVITRCLEGVVEQGFDATIPVGLEQGKARFEQFLQRLINNNESDYFFLRSEPAKGISEDHCAILRLGISIRAAEHYEICLAARLVSIKDTFKAKLGWLVGELYSRVGTEDWPSDLLRDKVKDFIEGSAVWLDKRRLRQLKKLVEQWRAQNPGVPLTKPQIEQLVSSTKDRKTEVIARAMGIVRQALELEHLIQNNQLAASFWIKLEQRLIADAQLTSLLKG